ncbi:hypothetical protein FQN54_006822 [Arachnomyces sp. PD_36]|nr:hypothetical protein FQN54_006822 [Arachnomyces sp. PD_36]
MDKLFDTSWTIHRLSPLYHGREFQTLLDNPAALEAYALRLRDLLRGDVLRGVQVGLGDLGAPDDALSKAGFLTECTWEALPTWSFWNTEHSLLEDPEQRPKTFELVNTLGILVTLEFENATYKAALLAGPQGYHDLRTELTHLPLLLTRLPSSLRQTFITFLSSNFDTRCSNLRLPSSFLGGELERYIAGVVGSENQRVESAASRSVIERIIKETQLTLSFAPNIAPSLKTLDVNIPRESLPTFYFHGSKMEERKGGSDTETPSRFMTALSNYFDTNLAMKLDLTDGPRPRDAGPKMVRLSRVSCGAFILGGEGRIKFIANAGHVAPEDPDDSDEEDEDLVERRRIGEANEALLQSLIQRAMGSDH